MSISKNKVCILLTACINPGGMSMTALQDVAERRRQYVNALHYYLDNTSIPIVFVENTNTDISGEFDAFIKSGRLEYITFAGNDYDKTLGKGYGEATMIIHAIENSEFLSRTKYVIKITGRLIVENIKDIISSNPWYLNNVFRCDLWEGQMNMRTMIFACRVKTLYCLIKENYMKLNDSRGYWFEHMLYDALLKNREIPVVPFLSPIIINGVTGSTNNSYYNRGYADNVFTELRLTNVFYRKRKQNYIIAITTIVRKIYSLRFKI